MTSPVASSSPTAVLLGFGAVGTRVAELLPRMFAELRVVGVADSSGGIYRASGLDLQALLAHKRGQIGDGDGRAESECRRGVATFAHGERVADSAALYARATNHMNSAGLEPRLNLLIDLSPVDLDSGGPSLPLLQRALREGISAVLANKAPLVLDFAGLKAAQAAGAAAAIATGLAPPRLAFSATVCGGLPVINVGVRDLRGARFERIEGIFNSTTNFILAEMEAGRSREDALRQAQRVGIAEADPTLDVEGFDTANKLVILSNEVLGQRVKLGDVSVTGISGVSDDDVQAALATGECIRLVARAAVADPAEWTTSSANGCSSSSISYTYTVAPERVKFDSHLGACRGTSMCCRYVTDVFETIDLHTNEKGVYPTAAAVLRDCYDVLHADSVTM